MNLLQETIEILKENNKTSDNVLWVGSSNGKFVIEWCQFKYFAASVNYHNGYGGAEIATDLVVVGDGWWLERDEYDGSEWWDFKRIPIWLSDSNKFLLVKSKHNHWEMKKIK